MGTEPLVLHIGDWKLQVDVSDADTRICIITDDAPNSYRWVRMSPRQAVELRDYLNATVPVVA